MISAFLNRFDLKDELLNSGLLYHLLNAFPVTDEGRVVQRQCSINLLLKALELPKKEDANNILEILNELNKILDKAKEPEYKGDSTLLVKVTNCLRLFETAYLTVIPENDKLYCYGTSIPRGQVSTIQLFIDKIRKSFQKLQEHSKYFNWFNRDALRLKRVIHSLATKYEIQYFSVFELRQEERTQKRQKLLH